MIVLLAGGEQRHIINRDRKTVTCLAWAADGSHLVSGESGHKPAVKVWSLQTAESSLVSLTGHKSGVGRHLKFWYLESSKSGSTSGTVPLHGRSAIMGEQRNNNFLDVACGKGALVS